MKKQILYGQRIKELRERRGWTQEQLAEVAGIESTRTIQRVEKNKTKGAETLQAIAGAFDVELSALQITRRIAESELARVRLARTAKEFISAENADTCHAFTKNIIVSLQPEIEDRVNDLMRAVFCDREYIDRDEPGMWDSYLDSIKEPLQELVDLGFAFFMLDERRDILLKPLNGIAPKEDHIPNWGIRHYLLVARHGCFQLDRSSPLHQFNESCPSCGETLLTLLREQGSGAMVYANALFAIGPLGDENKVRWCDTCFPPVLSGSRIGLDYMEMVTGMRREELQRLYEAIVDTEPFMEGLS